MKFVQLILIALARSIVIVTNNTAVQARNLRRNNDCTINAIALLPEPGEPPIKGEEFGYDYGNEPPTEEEEFGCDYGNGLFVPLHLSKAQKKSLRHQAASGNITYGKSKIDVNGATFNQDGSITMPTGKSIYAEARKNHVDLFDHRNLRITTKASKRYFLLFRVTDAVGRVYPDSPAVMSDNVFGTGGDNINLRTQLSACSVGKYTVIPGAKPYFDISGLQSARGVIDIELPISLDNDRNAVRNAALSKANEVMALKFGYSPTSTSLTTFTDHALFSLEDCHYTDCNFAAFASVGGYYQVG